MKIPATNRKVEVLLNNKWVQGILVKEEENCLSEKRYTVRFHGCTEGISGIFKEDCIRTGLSVWEVFRMFLDELHIGQEFTRQQLIQYFKEYGYLERTYTTPPAGYRVFSLNTMDGFRNLTEKCGYIAKGQRAGEFKVLKHFPYGYSSTELRLEYDNHWKK